MSSSTKTDFQKPRKSNSCTNQSDTKSTYHKLVKRSVSEPTLSEKSQNNYKAPKHSPLVVATTRSSKYFTAPLPIHSDIDDTTTVSTNIEMTSSKMKMFNYYDALSCIVAMTLPIV